MAFSLGGFAGDIVKAAVGPLVSGAFSKSSAKQQMEFQQYNSDTAHRREIADLRAAGLNPILTAKYGGASTPPGAGYQIPEIKLPEAFTQAATAKNLASQGQVLDAKATEAKILNDTMKEYNWIPIAKLLSGSTLTDKIFAYGLSRGEKVDDIAKELIGRNSSSAKDYGTSVEEYEEKKNRSDDDSSGIGNVLEIPIHYYDKPKKKTKEELKKEYEEKTRGMKTREKQEFYRDEFRKYWR